VLIRPAEGGLLLHTLYYPDELHEAHRSQAPKAKYSAKELELARSLVNHLKAPFKPQEFKDTYRENVERLIEQKQKGRKITAVKQPHRAPVVDLMDALKRSLKASPRQSEQKSADMRAPKKKTSRRKVA
jgi:DNA end-binding protein Ku